MRQSEMRHEASQGPLLVMTRGSKRDMTSGKPGMPTLLPVARDTLQEQAYLRLREALMSGHFVPGQAITLRAAAEALGTSPMPVRDALRRLEIEHALVPRSNRTLGVPEMTYTSLTELREVRMALEGLAAEKAALRITADEIAVAETHYQAMVAAASASNPDEYMRANWLFHSAIYRASQSHLLVSLIEPSWMRVGPYVRLMLPDRRALVDSLENHLDALRALHKRDGVAAREAIQRDIFESAEGLAGVLRAREDILDVRAANNNPERRGRLRRRSKQQQERR
jgi:DNA-binding GntR family transcriptional regulator